MPKSKLRKELSYKSKKLVKNMNEDERLIRAMDAYDPSAMYLSDYEVQRTISESFDYITNLRDDWN